jgi:hypothetical protein
MSFGVCHYKSLLFSFACALLWFTEDGWETVDPTLSSRLLDELSMSGRRVYIKIVAFLFSLSGRKIAQPPAASEPSTPHPSTRRLVHLKFVF